MENTNKLKDLAVADLIKFFESAESSDEGMNKAKMSLGVLGAISRIIATDRVNQAMKLSVIRSITDNPEDRARYIEATLPDYMPKKFLESGQ